MAYAITAVLGIALGVYPAWQGVTGLVDWQRGELEKRRRTKAEVIIEAAFGFACLAGSARFLFLALNSN